MPDDDVDSRRLQFVALAALLVFFAAGAVSAAILTYAPGPSPLLLAAVVVFLVTTLVVAVSTFLDARERGGGVWSSLAHGLLAVPRWVATFFL